MAVKGIARATLRENATRVVHHQFVMCYFWVSLCRPSQERDGAVAVKPVILTQPLQIFFNICPVTFYQD